MSVFVRTLQWYCFTFVYDFGDSHLVIPEVRNRGTDRAKEPQAM